MKRVFVYVATFFLFSGCAFGNFNRRLYSDNEIFSKKMECSKFQDDIEMRLSHDDVAVKKSLHDRTLFYSAFQKIFYSPKSNSCLYYFTTQEVASSGDITFGYFLIDALSGEPLVSKIGCDYGEVCAQRMHQARDSFLAQMKQYE